MDESESPKHPSPCLPSTVHERSICRRCFRSSAGRRTPVLLRVRVAVSQNRATENNRCPGCLMTRRNRITPWCSAVAAGFVGTTTMSGTPWLERRVRHHLQKPVDCDASSHVVQAASTLLRIDPGGAGRRRALFLLVHRGYGSTAGVGYRGIREVVDNDARAASMFYGACQGVAFVLFPTLGGPRLRGGRGETSGSPRLVSTPCMRRRWRWPRGSKRTGPRADSTCDQRGTCRVMRSRAQQHVMTDYSTAQLTRRLGASCRTRSGGPVILSCGGDAHAVSRCSVIEVECAFGGGGAAIDEGRF